MSSKAARRRRHQGAAKARPPSNGAQARQLAATRTYTADDVLALLTDGRMGGSTAMPRDPSWGQLPFGPGEPLRPAFISPPRKPGAQPEPRLGEYPQSYNLQISQQSHVNWRTLQDAADMPLFRKCIKRRQGICELDYAVVVDPAAVTREAMLSGQAKTDVEKALREKYTAEISRATDWLAMPDRKNGLDWTAWTKLLMENMLKYDATVVYPRRTLGGQLFSLEVPDGHLFKPLIDESGGRPMPPYPAVQQILYGFPRGEYTADMDAEGGIPGGLTADEILYRRRTIRGWGSPYGLPDVEVALLDGLIWMHRMGWIMAEYTEGATPVTYLETDNDIGWSVPQWETWTQALNDFLGGSTGRRFKIKPFPPGTKVVQTADIPERYKPDYDMFLLKLVAGDFGLTATEVGFPEVGSLGASFHEGEEDVLNRVTRIPDAKWIGGLATELMIRHNGMPPALKVQFLGLESEDEAADDAVAQARVASGRMTMNEDRGRLGLPAYDFEEADMPQLQTQRGIVFIEGSSKQAPPGVLLGPATLQSGASPEMGGGQSGQQNNGPGTGQDETGADSKKPQASKPGQQDKPAAAKSVPHRDAVAELAAFRRWGGRGTRPFECHVLTKADALALAPELLNNSRIVFKDADPKAPARRGLAGTGTRS